MKLVTFLSHRVVSDDAVLQRLRDDGCWL